MKIFVLGTRGIPAIQGGVEQHCEQLYPRVVARGNIVFLCTRTPYVRDKIPSYHGVRLIHCCALRKKNFEAIIHTLMGLLKALPFSPDIIHIHAVGPSLLAPLAKLLGFKVVVTNHGPDYERKKWGEIAKFALRLGEKVGGCCADEVIAISKRTQHIVQLRCNRKGFLIPNGVDLPPKTQKTDFLAKLHLIPHEYVLAVGRFVPEKGFHDLIKAFTGNFSHLKLVIAGDADHETAYSTRLRKMARQDKRIILTGFITGEELNQIYSNALLFVLPSYHEGLPIALLEALSYGLPVLVSDIPANKEVKLSSFQYFGCGDQEDLRKKMEKILHKKLNGDDSKQMTDRVKKKYNWDHIADKTIEVYQRVLS